MNDGGPSPDFAGACAYAQERLSNELPDWLTYHTVAHTRDIVLPAARALAAASGVDGRSLQLLEVAVWFHDIGYIERYDDNEPIAVEIVREVLPQFGFDNDDIETIADIIWATVLPQRPQNLLGQLMADADLDALGHPDFWAIQESLRLEHAHIGRPVDEPQWTDDQIAFVGSHTYFTAAARARNDEARRRHIEELLAKRATL